MTILIVSEYGPCASVDRICVDYKQKTSANPSPHLKIPRSYMRAHESLTKLSKIGKLKIRIYKCGSAENPLLISAAASLAPPNPSWPA